jgi:hypothetical protein
MPAQRGPNHQPNRPSHLQPQRHPHPSIVGPRAAITVGTPKPRVPASRSAHYLGYLPLDTTVPTIWV